jgi:Tfp pilus assembly PilM family ATPase
MISFPFKKKNKGHIGIAFHDGGVVMGQCGWTHGQYQRPTVLRMEKNPREISAQEWQKFIHNSPITGMECSISLPASIAHHQVLRLPNMSSDEIKEAAAWEMADRLGVDRATLQMDAIHIGSGGDVLAIAIEQPTLSNLLDPIYEAGLQPLLIEPQCISVSRTMSLLHRRHSDQSTVRSVFDFGMNDSCFMVLAGDSLVFYKHFEYCGNTLIESIASHTGVTKVQAMRMLEDTRDVERGDEVCKAVRDATRAIHETIATDLMKCIRHYGVTNRGPLSTQLIITGSSGWNVNLANILSSSCNQEIVSDVLCKHINPLPKEILETAGWQVSLGASLAALQPNKHRRNSDQLTKEAA